MNVRLDGEIRVLIHSTIYLSLSFGRRWSAWFPARPRSRNWRSRLELCRWSLPRRRWRTWDRLLLRIISRVAGAKAAWLQGQSAVLHGKLLWNGSASVAESLRDVELEHWALQCFWNYVVRPFYKHVREQGTYSPVLSMMIDQSSPDCALGGFNSFLIEVIRSNVSRLAIIQRFFNRTNTERRALGVDQRWSMVPN